MFGTYSTIESASSGASFPAAVNDSQGSGRPNGALPPGAAPAPTEGALDLLLQQALVGSSRRDAVAAVAAATCLPRRQVYARAVALSDGTKA